MDKVGRVTRLVSDISEASNAQARGLLDINEGLFQVDAVTQASTANAEAIAASSGDLTSDACDLEAQLGTFTLRDQATVGGDILDRLPPEMLQQLAELLQSIPKAS